MIQAGSRCLRKGWPVSNKALDVITFMDLCVDVMVYGNVVPQFGQTEKIVQDYQVELGGSCSIFASQAGKLGLRTAGVGVVGNDAYGDLIRSRLEQSGMIMDHVTTDASLKTGMGIALCTVDDRAILTYLGTIDALGPDNVPANLFRQARHLHIGSYFLMRKLQPTFKEMARLARSNGMTVSLDTNWDPEETWDSGIWDLLQYVDIFLPNENELKWIAKQNSVEKAIGALEGIVPITVLKQGEKGAVAYSGGNAYPSQSLKVEAIDAVGAGDSFDAGFVYGYLSGYDLSACVRIGCMCGSMSTTRPGGVAGQVSRDGLMKLMKKEEQ